MGKWLRALLHGILCFFCSTAFAQTGCPLDAPVVQAATICAGNSATVMVISGGSGFQWYDAPADGNLLASTRQFSTPALTETTTYYVQAVGDSCVSARTPVKVVVMPLPEMPNVADVTICSGSRITLSANGPGGTYEWYASETGGAPIIRSPDFTTPALTATTVFYVQTTNGSCTSPRRAVTVTVNPVPHLPKLTGATVCAGSPAVLTASVAEGEIRWYNPFGDFIGTGDTITTPPLKKTSTYYAQTIMGGCGSGWVAVTATVKPVPPNPSVSGAIICAGSSATLKAFAPGGDYQWYEAESGGSPVATGAVLQTGALLKTTTYYIQTTIDDCTSGREPVVVTVYDVIPAPVVQSITTCAGSPVTLTATGSPAAYAWYDAPTGGTLLGSADTYTTPALQAGATYYVESVLGGCTSVRTPVTVTVNALPPAPVVTSATACPGTPAVLTANIDGGTVQWFDAPTGGNLLYTGYSFTTPPLTATTTYYAQLTAVPCSSIRVPVTATVTAQPVDPLFNYARGSYFSTDADAVPVIFDPAGGTFTAEPAGLVIDPATGKIAISASADGDYLVTYTSKGACPFTGTARIHINPPSGFSYNGPFCQYGTNPLPALRPGAAKGYFSATPAGLVINSETGEIDLAASKPGTYTVTNAIPPKGTYPGSSTSSEVVINAGVTISAGPDVTVAAGTPVVLNGVVTGANGVTWSGGQGTFSNTNALNPVYTPAPAETTVTLTITSLNPPGPCSAVSDQLVVNINQPPSGSGATVCYDTPATLRATAGAAAIEWYDAADGGTLLQSGSEFVTPALTADKTYFVQATLNNVVSGRTAVKVSVLNRASAPSVSGTATCYGTSATLTATGADAYRWYDAPTGGNLVSVTATYTTPRLTTGVTYYVEGTSNGCVSARAPVTVAINPVAVVTSAETASICSEKLFAYNVTSNVRNAIFTWSRAAVTGIGNAAANGQGALISETLINSTDKNVRVVYLITPIANGCPGTPFELTVTVAPKPAVISPAKERICNNSTPGYAIKFNTGGVSYSWSRAAVPGISNAAISAQSAPIIREVLSNTSNVPKDVTYALTFSTGTCGSATFNYIVTVNPTPRVTSASAGAACSGVAQAYVLKSNVDSATFTWDRPYVAGISNAAVTGAHDNVITEALVNTTPLPVIVYYKVTPTAYGCSNSPFYYRVTVYPKIAPVITVNSPVCKGDALRLSGTQVDGAAYAWQGPNGFVSASREPVITNAGPANAGTYTLHVTVNGCTSDVATTLVSVTEPPVTVAGPDQSVCAATAGIKLAGSITGGSGQGTWSTSGSGTFIPSPSALDAQYVPSAADRKALKVKLTLASADNRGCAPSYSSLTVTMQPTPIVDAGADQDVCSQAKAVGVEGKIVNATGGFWTSTGNGTFAPSNRDLKAVYIPGAGDLLKGTVTLRLTSEGNGLCDAVYDEVKVRFVPPPTLDAGERRLLFKGKTLTLQPSVSDENVKYQWSPATNLSSATVKNPVVTGVKDQLYTLTVTDVRGCVSTDTVYVKVLDPLTIHNTFTPNGDGINDTWNIPELIRYPGPKLSIFTRYGERVFFTQRYDTPWDGIYNGVPLPQGVYYYVIETNFEGKIYSGYITLLR